MGIEVKLVKSAAGASERQKDTLVGLGLGRLQSVRLLKDTPATRGMIRLVKHLVQVEKVDRDPQPRARMKPAKLRRREALRSRLAAVQAKTGGEAQ